MLFCFSTPMTILEHEVLRYLWLQTPICIHIVYVVNSISAKCADLAEANKWSVNTCCLTDAGTHSVIIKQCSPIFNILSRMSVIEFLCWDNSIMCVISSRAISCNNGPYSSFTQTTDSVTKCIHSKRRNTKVANISTQKQPVSSAIVATIIIIHAVGNVPPSTLLMIERFCLRYIWSSWLFPSTNTCD